MRKAVIDFRHIFSWLVFLVWAGIFGIFYFSGSYIDFLNPQFSWLMVIGFVLCSVFFAVIFLSGPSAQDCSHDGVQHHNHVHGPSIMRMLVLLVPVLFAANFGSWKLGTFAFDKRAVGINRIGGMASQDGAQSQAVSDNLNPDELRDATLMELHNGFEKLVGQRVSTLGMYMSKTPGLPDDTYVIFRFVVVCCAADAQPLAVMIKGPRLDGVADETWLKVEGPLKSIELGGQPAILIEAETAAPTSPPANPYLFPAFR